MGQRVLGKGAASHRVVREYLDEIYVYRYFIDCGYFISLFFFRGGQERGRERILSQPRQHRA